MFKFSYTAALASALAFIPVCANAEVSVADSMDYDSVIETQEMPSLDMGITANYVTPAPPQGGRHPGPGPGARPVPVQRVQRTTVVRRTTVVQPQPVVVVEQPSTVVVSEPAQETTVAASSSSGHEGAILGIGIRVAGAYQRPIPLEDGSSLATTVNGGAGYYIKFRPVRYISVEFVNDFLYGKYVDYDGGYLRVPVSLGIRGHVLDYGMLDVYGVAAASVTFVSLSDGFKQLSTDPGYDDTHFALFGGQFGAGIGFVGNGFEIGLDVRYIIEQSPEHTILGYGEKGKTVHGCIFSLNVGLAM